MTRAPDIARVRAHGARIRGDLIELRLLRATGNATRIGIIVPRHDHTAVARNLVKRRLRELVRESRQAAPPFADAIVFAGPRAYGATFEALRRELRALWRRATP